MPQLTLTQAALLKLASAQQTGVQIRLSQFELTNSADGKLEVKGDCLYKAGISSIGNENATTVRVKCLMPAGLTINAVVQKCYVYDEQGDIFAYGLINSFKYTQIDNIEMELNIYLSFSETASVSLTVPSDSFVDYKTFNEHNHDERYYLKSEIDTKAYEQPFWRLSRNQLGTVTGGSMDHFIKNPNITISFEIYKTIHSDVPWENRDAEEQEILTAMGRHGQRYFAPSYFNIVRVRWSGAIPMDISTGKYWLFYQFINYHNWVTIGCYAKLINGGITTNGGFPFEGITDQWGLCGSTASLEANSYTHSHAYPSSESGEILFCMLASVAGRFPLDKANPRWGYVPYLERLED
ncbi:hypothetical protein [Caedibacter taeniospiralis]|jgi:hypothetical protein|uniref:hypothetical protein n=1 Tax=Caedibacter taeniospiralis TaxID=28907 RepID=UPI0037BEBA1F